MNERRYYPSTELHPDEELSKEEAMKLDWYVAAILDENGDALQAEIFQEEELQHLVYHRENLDGLVDEHKKHYDSVPFDAMLPLAQLDELAVGRVYHFDKQAKLEDIEEIYIDLDSGLIVAEHTLDADEQLQERRVYTYDDNGEVSKAQVYDDQDQLLFEESAE